MRNKKKKTEKGKMLKINTAKIIAWACVCILLVATVVISHVAKCVDLQRINLILLAILVVHFLFGFIVKRIIKSENDLSKYYFAVNRSSETTRLVDAILDMWIPIFLTATLTFIVIGTIVVIICKSRCYTLIEYFCSINWDEWFHTIIVDVGLTIILGTGGLLYLFRSRTDRSFAFCSIEDLLRRWGILNRLVRGSALYLVGIVGTIPYYYIRSMEVSLLRSLWAVIWGLSVTYIICRSITAFIWVLYKIIRFTLGELHNDVMLEDVYKDVRNWPRKGKMLLKKADDPWVWNEIEYMLKCIPENELDNTRLQFVSYMDLTISNVDFFRAGSKSIQNNICKSFSLLSCTLLCVFIMICYKEPTINDVLACCSVPVLFWILIKTMWKHDVILRQIATNEAIGSWGFVIERESPVYFSDSNCKQLNGEYCEILRAYYCIVCAFRDMLFVESDGIDRFLNMLRDHVIRNKCDILLYSVCICLYYKETKDDKSQHWDQLKHIIVESEVKTKYIRKSTEALLTDILRKDSGKIDEYVEQLHKI